jgi:hypothetical protein
MYVDKDFWWNTFCHLVNRRSSIFVVNIRKVRSKAIYPLRLVLVGSLLFLGGWIRASLAVPIKRPNPYFSGDFSVWLSSGRRIESINVARPVTCFMRPANARPRPVYVPFGGAVMGQNSIPPPHALLLLRTTAMPLP